MSSVAVTTGSGGRGAGVWPGSGRGPGTSPSDGRSTPVFDTRLVSRLGAYTTLDGSGAREVVSLSRPDGSSLLVDWRAVSLGDARLIAHLAPDEPDENARLLSGLYLADATRGRCRPLSDRDLMPFGELDGACEECVGLSLRTVLIDARGGIYSLREMPGPHHCAQLRWVRSAGAEADACEIVALRDVVAALEDYEPARTITALALASDRNGVSARRLQVEATRLASSPLVLNRGLREAVHAAVARGLSMSEIAMRCGRLKRGQGTQCGETSWLARRIGEMPEAGKHEPTRWVHSNTLALIAREGLGLGPNEVEV
jgi:hypothetical protein